MHSTFVYQTILPFKATAPVELGFAVKADGIVDGEAACSLATSSTDPIIGIAVASCGAGETVDVQVGGAHFNAVMGGAATPGAFVTAGPDGRFVPAQPGDRSVGVLVAPRDHVETITENTPVVVMVNLAKAP